MIVKMNLFSIIKQSKIAKSVALVAGFSIGMLTFAPCSIKVWRPDSYNK